MARNDREIRFVTSNDLAAELDRLADHYHVTRNAVMNVAIREGLKRLASMMKEGAAK